MTFDERLAERVWAALGKLECTSERQMFGGIGYFHCGHMVCGVLGSEVVLRIGSDAYDDALNDPATKRFEPTGRPMRGWVTIPADRLEDDAHLAEWIRRSVAFVRTLTPKA